MRRHSEQLQLPRSAGGSDSVRRTAPQWQLPSIIQHLLQPGGDQLPGLADPTLVEMGVSYAQLQVHLQRMRAAIARGLNEAGRRIDRARRADRDEQIAALERLIDPLHRVWHLAEPDDVRADASLHRARRT